MRSKVPRAVARLAVAGQPVRGYVPILPAGRSLWRVGLAFGLEGGNACFELGQARAGAVEQFGLQIELLAGRQVKFAKTLLQQGTQVLLEITRR